MEDPTYFSRIESFTETNKTGFYFAFAALFLELVVKSILIYQESFWGWNFYYNQFFYRYVVKVPVFLILGFIFFMKLKKSEYSRKEKFLFGTIFLFGIYLLIIVFLNWRNEDLHDYNVSNLFLIGSYGYYFLIGYFLISDEDQIKRVRYIIFAGQAITSLQIILFYNFSSSSIDIENLQHNNYIHLLLGSNYALWSIITLSVVENRKRLWIYLLFIPFLFSLSSRAAFYCYISLSPIMLYSKSKNYLKYAIIAFGVFVLLIVLNPFSILDHRMFAVFTGNDVSLNYRIETFRTAIPDMLKNFMWGDYGGFFRYQPPANTYMHNMLSFWSQFGLLPFLFVIVLVLFSLFEIKQSLTSFEKLSVFMKVNFAVYLIFTMLLANSFTYSQFFILFGLIAFSNTGMLSISLANNGGKK